MFHFLYVILIGGLAGWLASMITGTRARMGCLLNILVGVVGGIVGAFVFRKLGFESPNGHFIGPLIVAFVGATLFLGILKLLTGKK